MKNQKIRIALIAAGLHMYDLADILQVSEASVTRMMRKELPEDEQDRITELIRQEGVRRNGNNV